MTRLVNTPCPQAKQFEGMDVVTNHKYVKGGANMAQNGIDFGGHEGWLYNPEIIAREYAERQVYRLATKVAQFVWANGDRYELMDNYGYDGYSVFENEVALALKYRDGIEGMAEQLIELGNTTLAREVEKYV